MMKDKEIKRLKEEEIKNKKKQEEIEDNLLRFHLFKTEHEKISKIYYKIQII